MNLVGKNTLEEFKSKHGMSVDGLIVQINSWIKIVEHAKWKNHHDLKNQFHKASIIANNNVIFNILGNRYRIWVKIDYEGHFVFVKKIGTHKEYDKWNIKNK